MVLWGVDGGDVVFEVGCTAPLGWVGPSEVVGDGYECHV